MNHTLARKAVRREALAKPLSDLMSKFIEGGKSTAFKSGN
jgi:hypothetical protein